MPGMTGMITLRDRTYSEGLSQLSKLSGHVGVGNEDLNLRSMFDFKAKYQTITISTFPLTGQPFVLHAILT